MIAAKSRKRRRVGIRSTVSLPTARLQRFTTDGVFVHVSTDWLKLSCFGAGSAYESATVAEWGVALVAAWNGEGGSSGFRLVYRVDGGVGLAKAWLMSEMP